jgi:FixJ family two-component response regulator
VTGCVTITLQVIAVAALEGDVLGSLVAGFANEGIAYQLGISARTIGNHVERRPYVEDAQRHRPHTGNQQRL